MSGVPDGTGFRLIEKAIEKYRSHSTISMIYSELYEKIHSLDNKEIEPGNYIMYIDRDYGNMSTDYILIIIRNGTKLRCSIYDILKTDLVKDL